MSDPFTIRIFVPDGDREGIRLIHRFDWTGLGSFFPRANWADVRARTEVTRTGVYMLVGDQREGDDLPTTNRLNRRREVPHRGALCRLLDNSSV
jgi:hypothetical protein